MPENLLTDAKIRSAKSTDRDWKPSDGGGLFLLVKPTGGKLWRWKYRLQGKENLFAIGGFPQVSLAEARAAREKARALVPVYIGGDLFSTSSNQQQDGTGRGLTLGTLYAGQSCAASPLHISATCV